MLHLSRFTLWLHKWASGCIISKLASCSRAHPLPILVNLLWRFSKSEGNLCKLECCYVRQQLRWNLEPTRADLQSCVWRLAITKPKVLSFMPHRSDKMPLLPRTPSSTSISERLVSRAHTTKGLWKSLGNMELWKWNKQASTLWVFRNYT